MTIVQDLYNIYDKEQAKYRARKSSQGQLLIEMQHNLAFLREGLRESLDQRAIIDGLETVQYVNAGKAGLNLNSLQKKTLERATYAAIREFERYRSWHTAKLIENVYERIATLKKLAARSSAIDLTTRLRNLFKLMMVLVAHIQGRQLKPIDKAKP